MISSQDKILNFCLKNCIFDSWTNKLLENACKQADLDKNYWKIPFPNGVTDVIDYYTDKSNEQMLEGIDLEGLRTPEKIKALIKNRLTQHEHEKEIIRTCVAVYMLHPAKGTAATYRTVDSMWRAAGDTATDWNFYSKRTLLAGVYGTTLTYWLADDSEDYCESWRFLDDRLNEVAKFGKFKGKMKEMFSSWGFKAA